MAEGLIKYVDPRAEEYPRYNKSQFLDPLSLKTVIEASKLSGVDPNTLLAVGLQESNLGKDLPGSLSYVHFSDTWRPKVYSKFAEDQSGFSTEEIDSIYDYLDSIGRFPSSGALPKFIVPSRTKSIDGWEKYLPKEDFDAYTKGLSNRINRYHFARSSAEVADRLKSDIDKYGDELTAIQAFNGLGKVDYYNPRTNKKHIINQAKEKLYAKRVKQLEQGFRNNEDIQKMINKIYGN